MEKQSPKRLCKNINKNKDKDGNIKGCWDFDGLYLAKTCLNLERINAMVARNFYQDDGEHKVVVALVNPLDLTFNQISLINDIGKASKSSNLHATLIHIDGKHAMIVVDTGATHTFVDINVATKFVLRSRKSPSYNQTISSKAQATVGMGYDVFMLTRSWM